MSSKLTVGSTHQLWLVTVMSFSRLMNPVPPLARIIFALTGEQNDICQGSSLYEGWSDRVRYHANMQSQTLTIRNVRLYCHMTRTAPSKTKQVESALRLDQPLRLDRLGVMLGVIRVKFADYKLTKASVTRCHCQMSHVVLTRNLCRRRIAGP